MPDLPPPRVTQASQAIRLATTLTGGVSLAVWMGGVARELDLLQQASAWRALNLDPDGGALSPESRAVLDLYFKLIDLLDVTVDIDVLSGTSAGGINAALLGYARANRCDLGRLRDLWLDLGAMLDLLRDPRDVDLPSLMYGDERMFAELAANIPKLLDTKLPNDRDLPGPRTTVLITTTLLDGETSRFTDSYGTPVQDIDHRGLFTFDEDLLRQMRASKQADALALAARSSASFPGAFEPSFLPFHDSAPETRTVPARPDMAPYASITRSHWVADGGLLDNQPLDVLLQRVFARRSRREVRRVLLFVVPSAGPSPSILPPTPGDDLSKPYGLLDSLRKDLEAMTSQSIASSLRAIHDHVDRSSARSDMRLQLAGLGTQLFPKRLLTEPLLATYQSSAADHLARKVVAALMLQLGTWQPAEPTDPPQSETIPVGWQAELAPGRNAEQLCRDAIRDGLLGRPVASETGPAEPDTPNDPGPVTAAVPADEAGLAGFGVTAFDDARAAAIAMVRLAFKLAVTAADRAVLGRLTEAIHAARGEPHLPHVRQYVCKQLLDAPEIRSLSLPEAALKLALGYLDSTAVPAQAWLDLGGALVEPDFTYMLNRLVSGDPDSARPPAHSRASQRQLAAEQLQTYLDYLYQSGADKLRVTLQLFDLAAAQRALLPPDASVDQPLEFIELSSDTSTLLDPDRQTAQSKLTGLQLHHFGAFYKRSWRANDWMWGRLDGAGWLVHVLLDPRRIKTITAQMVSEKPQLESPDLRARQPAAAWFIDQLIALGVPEPDDAPPANPVRRAAASPGQDQDLPAGKPTKRGLWDELMFLDDDTVRVPVSLPMTSLWVAQVWQQSIACEELPVVAGTVFDSRDGQQPDTEPNRIPAATARWAADLRRLGPAELRRDIAAQLTACPVPGETFATDNGSPLMVRTAAKAAATSAACLGSVKQLPAAVRPALTSMRTITLAGYRVTNGTRGVARMLILVGFLGLLLGIALAIQQSLLFGMSGLMLIAIGAYLIVFGAWQTSRLALSAIIAATLTVGAISLTLPAVRRYLFGGSDNGLVGRHISGLLRWLDLSWWHPLAALGILLLLPLAVGLAMNAVRRRAPHHLPQRPDGSRPSAAR